MRIVAYVGGLFHHAVAGRAARTDPMIWAVAARLGLAPRARAAAGELDAFCRELRDQLGPFGYQWLCACAVYPGLRFTLSTHLGVALAAALDRPPPDEEEYAALFRLPWFRKGWMPDPLRLRLIADLVPAARQATREAIERVLYSALAAPADAPPSRPLALLQPPRRWRRQLRELLGVAPADAAENDAIFARYMAGRSLSPAALALDRRLTRRLGRRRMSWLDRGTVAALLLMPLVAWLAWRQSDTWLKPAFERTREENRTIRTFQDCPQCPKMVVVPSGSFLMGSPAGETGRYSDEDPQHLVQIKEFAIGQHEVTFDEWEACVAAKGCKGYEPDDIGWGRGRRPVINVSWDDAQAYVQWLSGVTGATYRLPSEAEWEYAARAGTTTAYFWGETSSTDLANYAGAVGQTKPVGSYAPNPWGLYDTAGNVLEWVEDCLHGGYDGSPSDGSPRIGDCASLTGRVVRGGSWGGNPGGARSAIRGRGGPDFRFIILGFRVSWTLTP